MAARKVRRRAKKAARKNPPARKAAGRKTVAGFGKHAAKELALGPLERAGESLVDAARRLWLSAGSLVASGSLRRSTRRAKAKDSR